MPEGQQDIGAIKPPYMHYPSAPTSHHDDPSSLTTQFVMREISSLKELTQAETTSIKDSIKIAHDDLVRVPTEVQKVASSLQLLLETKIFYEAKLADKEIKHITEKIEWIDRIRLEQKADSSMALNAALASAKELVTVTNNSAQQAVQKQEAAFNKQIDQLILVAQTMGNNLGDKIADVKDLVITTVSATKGKKEGVQDFRDWIPWVIAIGAAIWAVYKA